MGELSRLFDSCVDFRHAIIRVGFQKKSAVANAHLKLQILKLLRLLLLIQVMMIFITVHRSKDISSRLH